MKIEVGKFYKTRGGEIVAVFEKIKSDFYPFRAISYKYGLTPLQIGYTTEGRTHTLPNFESPFDIISEWNPEHNANHNENSKTELNWTQTIT